MRARTPTRQRGQEALGCAQTGVLSRGPQLLSPGSRGKLGNPALYRKDKEAQEEGNWPKAPSRLMDATGLALSGRVPPPLPCPAQEGASVPGRLQDQCQCASVLSSLAGCLLRVHVRLSVCPMPSPLPRALEGAVSLSGRARLSPSYAPAQRREPGWRPGGRAGWAAKGFPRARPQRPGGQAGGRTEQQSSQMPLTWLLGGWGGGGGLPQAGS